MCGGMASGMAGRWSVQGLGSWWPVAWQASGKRLASAWQAGGKRPVFFASACFAMFREAKTYASLTFLVLGIPPKCFLYNMEKKRNVGGDRVWVSAWIALAAKRHDSRILPGPWFPL